MLDPVRYFGALAGEYAACRPEPPAGLIAHLVSLAPDRDLAWDAGCGSGQVSRLLAPHFESVLATDAAEGQIAAAHGPPNVSFRVAGAEEGGVPPGGAALVTAAQAAHWFRIGPFWEEVRRALRPRGVAAVWCYGPPRVDGSIDRCVDALYSGAELAAFWPPERRLIDGGYRDLPFPFQERPAPEFTMAARWNWPTFAGYLGTWLAVRRATGPDAAAFLRRTFGRLEGLWGAPQTLRPVRWPVAVRVGLR